MNNQQRRVYKNCTPRHQAIIDAERKAKIAEILNGRVANDPDDFQALKERRKQKMEKRELIHRSFSG